MCLGSQKKKKRKNKRKKDVDWDVERERKVVRRASRKMGREDDNHRVNGKIGMYWGANVGFLRMLGSLLI